VLSKIAWYWTKRRLIPGIGKWNDFQTIDLNGARGGIEPPTRGFSDRTVTYIYPFFNNLWASFAGLCTTRHNNAQLIPAILPNKIKVVQELIS
jgi:hypothetical protein